MKTIRGFGNKKCLLFVTAFLVCFICSHSFAAGKQEDKWRMYYSADDGCQYFYNPQSIVQTAKTVNKTDQRRKVKSRQRNKKAWLVKVREKMVFNESHSELGESKVLREFDCSEKKVHTLMRSNFYKNGALQIKGKTGVWQGIDSEPHLIRLFHVVCPP